MKTTYFLLFSQVLATQVHNNLEILQLNATYKKYSQIQVQLPFSQDHQGFWFTVLELYHLLYKISKDQKFNFPKGFNLVKWRQ